MVMPKSLRRGPKKALKVHFEGVQYVLHVLFDMC